MGGTGGYYTPSLEDGYVNYEPSKPNMPEVEAIDIWNRVKIWSAADGITCSSTIPYDFDFSQIEKGEVVDVWLELNNFDASRYEGRNVGACILLLDEEKRFFMFLIFVSIGNQFTCGFIQQNLDGNEQGATHYLKAGSTYVDFTADTEGWYFGNFDTPEEVIKVEGADTSIYITDFNNLKIVDFGSIQLEQASEAYGIKIENVAEDFINSVICFCLPRKYNYKIPKIPNTNKSVVVNEGGLDIPITPEDEGKFLMIQGGAVAKVAIPDIEEEVF